MDIIDVTGIGAHRAYFDQLRIIAERASSRKGETPRDHTSPHHLVDKFMMKLAYAAGSGIRDGHTLSTSQVPPSYTPCIRGVEELAPLMISRMTLENHHRGNFVLIHVLTPPDRMTAVMAIVEDEEGTAVLLQLYNQPEERTGSKEQILRVGDVCIIKDPFFKVATDGSYSLRVDHVSDILWLEDNDSRIPLKWRERVLCLDQSSSDIRKQGNSAVKNLNWAEAERLYTQAICTATTLEEGQLAHLNRSLANLRLNRPAKALGDALRGSMSGTVPNEKALFREAKALYSLREFEACMEKLSIILQFHPENTDARAEHARVKERLCEQHTGSYQFGSMYKQAEATPPLVDCATYIGSVAVRSSPRRGKGLFTTRPVKAGELLFCEKAFAYSYAGSDSFIGRSNTTILMDMNTGTMCVGGQAHLITQVVQKIYHNPSSAEVFTTLHHGDYTPVNIPEVDGAPIVDTFLVVKIIQLNGFGAPRSSYDSLKSAMPNGKENGSVELPGYSTCGIWPLASRINHSCITNCRRSFIGDMQIVRACQDMAADTELYFGYQAPLPYQTYEETQKNLRPWGFICDCALCLDKKSIPSIPPSGTFLQRKNLNKRLKAVLTPGAPMTELTRARKIIEDLENTYATREDVMDLIPRLELWDPYFALGAELLAKNQSMDGLEMLLKGLEALGFSIVAFPPRIVVGKKNRKRAKLEIKRWGQINDYVASTFLRMVHAYETLAPELCKFAKQYADVAYSICCGEKDTIGMLDPQLS